MGRILSSAMVTLSESVITHTGVRIRLDWPLLLLLEEAASSAVVVGPGAVRAWKIAAASAEKMEHVFAIR